MSELLPSAAELGLAALDHRAVTLSTMDDAHAAAAAGALAGTLIVADTQGQGRGRGGRVWESADRAGLWMTLIERPRDSEMLGVLALRVGMALALALEPFVDSPVRVKWPNDLFVGGGKLAGILIEARWRESMVDWVAIGVGVNTRVPEGMPLATAVRPGVTRAELLRVMIPAMREAAQRAGVLTEREIATWRARDLAIGRRISAPLVGEVMGIGADGALLVREPDSSANTIVHAGSLVFADSPPRVEVRAVADSSTT